jgi:hypothetical protein
MGAFVGGDRSAVRRDACDVSGLVRSEHFPSRRDYSPSLSPLFLIDASTMIGYTLQCVRSGSCIYIDTTSVVVF